MSFYGGIDLGGTKIQAAIVDEENSVLGSARRPTPVTGGPADIAAEMQTALRDAAKAAEVECAGGNPILAGVGVGSPGTIQAGNVTSARNLPDWEGTFPLADTLERGLGHPYAQRIADEMLPHLFADSRPPHVHVAALGDLGGAIGASLLVRGGA